MKTLEVLGDLIDLAITGLAGVSRRIAFMEKPSPKPSPSAGITEAMWSRVQAGKTYLKALLRLVIWCAIFPIPILAIGIISDLGWLVSIVGIFWTVWSFLLLALATPIGLLLEFILGGIRGMADRYVKFSLGVFLVELLFTLFVSVVPIQNNLSAVPIVIVASAILGVIAARGVQVPFTQKFISTIVTMIFIIFTLSFFFPKTFNSFRNWSSELDVQVSNRVEGIPSPQEMPSPVAIKPKESERINVPVTPLSKSDTLQNLDNEAVKNPENSLRIRRIEGVAYSFSKDVWAQYAGVYVESFYGKNTRYPKPKLQFTGLSYGCGGMEWDASYKIYSDHVKAVVGNLVITDGSRTHDYNTDVGIGYNVQLENAVFSDYRMTKTLIVFRTFGGDTPPPIIEKNFEMRKIDTSKAEPYVIGGEWLGSFDMPQEEGKKTSREFIARFVQHGFRFEGVVIDSYVEKDPYGKHSVKSRSRVEGFIIDDRVTFIKTSQKQTIGDSYVASFVQGNPSLEGKCYSGLYIGNWRMVRQRDFEGSPDDIIGVEMSHP